MTSPTPIIAQVFICRGPTCADPASMDRLQTLWRTTGVWRDIALTFSECMATCEYAGTACIIARNRVWWFNNIETTAVYEELLAWAQTTSREKRIAPFTPLLQNHLVERFSP